VGAVVAVVAEAEVAEAEVAEEEEVVVAAVVTQRRPLLLRSFGFPPRRKRTLCYRRLDKLR